MSIELHKIYKRKKSDRDIFQELMPFKIKEILLIANYYDAYTIEREGQFTDKIVGEYLQVNLYTAPRFTSVASEAEALKILSERHIDLIILMAGLDKQTPLVISRHLKDLYPNICQLMLVNNNSDLAYFHTIEDRLYESIERLFVWNGSTKIFLVMAKYIEDKMNLDRDTHLGDIRVILLVENSIRYYSRYLPLLYTEVMTQTQELIFSEPQDNDMSIVMKIRVRPKVILATNYEEAVYVIDHYRENLIGVISDVRYKRNGEEDEEAGIELIRYVKRTGAYIPCMLQSQEIENTVKAEELHAAFINKNSPTLAHDIQDFIKGYLGFGDFIFRNKNGEPIDRATSIEEFKQKLLSIPDESLIYHSIRNGISTWLMAHREITLAKTRAGFLDGDPQNPGTAGDDLAELLRAVELQAEHHPEPVPEGGGELAGPGGGPDEGEPGQVQADGVGRGALADDDVDGKVLHGRVENLLHRPVEAVDLVHKEDVVLVEVGEQGGQVPGLLNGRAGGDADVHPHLVGDDAGEGGLAQPRGAVEEDMVQGLVPELGRVDEHGEVLLGLFLADVLGQALGAQGSLPLVLRQRAEVINGVSGSHVTGKSRCSCRADLPSRGSCFLQGLADDLLQGEGLQVQSLQGGGDSPPGCSPTPPGRRWPPRPCPGGSP